MKNTKFAKLIQKFAMALPALAFVASIASLNSACYSVYHQPETPAALDAYRK